MPAEIGKLDLKLNSQKKIEDLIGKSVEQKEISKGKFAVHLGKRIKHVEISNENDCVKVKPKGWIDKAVRVIRLD